MLLSKNLGHGLVELRVTLGPTARRIHGFDGLEAGGAGAVRSA